MMDLYYSFIIPAYNESERLATSLPKVFAYIRERQLQAEVIVVNDGSTDDTAEVTRSFARQISRDSLAGESREIAAKVTACATACCTPTATFCCLPTRTCPRRFTKRPSCSPP